MKTVFADTSFWIAILNPKDALHTKAKEAAASLGPIHVVTSQMVLAELLNDFAARGPTLRQTAKRLVEGLARNPNTTIVEQTGEQFPSALLLYGERSDKAWALTDCASLLVMRSHAVDDALTNDRHFEQMGFKALLRA